ncbi:MAG: glycosyltransferase [Verrucomicrobiota bacterium]
MTLNILWLKSGPLHPIDTGGKIRTYQMLRELNRLHPVTYAALWPEGLDQSTRPLASEYSTAQHWIDWRETPKGTAAFYAELAGNLFSGLPYAIAKYQSAGMASLVRQLDQSGRFDLIISDFLLPSVHLFADGYRPATKSLLFQHNVESLIWKRTFETAGSALKRAYFRMQWQRMEAFERASCARYDGVVGVSDEDCDLMRKEFGLTNVLGSVPTGVDVDYFKPAATAKKPNSIMFLGSMDWQPNVDGAGWFAEEIWPLIKQEIPGVTLSIVGRKPVAKIQELGARDASIRVTGTVPDVRPHLAESELMIVPLRVGGGTRIKIYEAMAAGVPVVSTRIGAEGLAVTDGEDIALADEPAAFAGRVVELLKNHEMRRRMGERARDLVCRNFSWPSVVKVFDGYCQALCGAREGVLP